jgi:hypothetical protein
MERPTMTQSAKSGTREPSGKGGERVPRRLVLAALFDERGLLDVEEAAEALGMSKAQLAETAGLPRETLQKSGRREGPKAQARMREMLDIINLVQAWAGGPAQALAWYRAEPIRAFGGRTAEALVKSGYAAAVRDYVDHLATGGHA